MGHGIYGAAVVPAVVAFLLLSGPERERPLLPASAEGTVHILETDAARAPDDAEATRALAQAYLDADAPGLAVALVDAAPPAVRSAVRVAHVYARALVDQGRSEQALVEERSVLARCESVAEGVRGSGCDTFLLVSAVRRTDILRELVSRGVSDPKAHPEETLLAYRFATRQARVMVQ